MPRVLSAAQAADGTRGARAPERIVRVRELVELTGLSRTTVWRLERRGEFPRRRRIAGGIVGWLASEVEEWMRTRPAVEAGAGPDAAA